MLYSIHGFTKSKGSFINRETGETIDYDNIVFHTTHKAFSQYSEGCVTQDMKIASKLLNNYSDDDLKALIGKEVEFDIVLLSNGKCNVVGISNII